jgi:hypothetical protein
LCQLPAAAGELHHPTVVLSQLRNKVLTVDPAS